MQLDRRQLLASGLAAFAWACVRGGSSAGNGGLVSDAPITADTLAAAERLGLVSYTPREREQLLGSIEEQLELVRARRRFVPDHDLAPALRFDPRLPGRAYGPLQPGVTVPDRDPGPVPADDVDLLFAPLTSHVAWIRRGHLTSERLVGASLARLATVDERLHCVTALRREAALAEARALDAEAARGAFRGPLHGVPWGAKDLLDTAGLVTTWGAVPYRQRVPDRDAAVVTRLRDAGAVLVAKLTLGALAYGDIWYGGKTRNPWNTEEGSSGSSAGSAAAVAAGALPFAIGSETLGSIVSPSMRCGTVGLRPTFGRVSRYGAMALCWSLDKLGPITRTVPDAALVLSAIEGFDERDPGSVDVPLAWDGRRDATGLRVAFDPAWFEDANPLDHDALRLLREAGVELVERALPDLPWDALLIVLYAEAAAAFEALTLGDEDDRLVWQDPEAWPNTFRSARFLSAVDLVQADRLRRAAMRAVDDVLSDVHALVSPSFGGPLLTVTNFTGHPSLTVRTGFIESATRYWPESSAPEVPPTAVHRVPHGITLWGGLYDEGTLCRLGARLEDAAGAWVERPPACQARSTPA